MPHDMRKLQLLEQRMLGIGSSDSAVENHDNYNSSSRSHGNGNSESFSGTVPTQKDSTGSPSNSNTLNNQTDNSRGEGSKTQLNASQSTNVAVKKKTKTPPSKTKQRKEIKDIEPTVNEFSTGSSVEYQGMNLSTHDNNSTNVKSSPSGMILSIGSGHGQVVGFQANFNAESNHSGSISHRSPLKFQPESKYGSAKLIQESNEDGVGYKRKDLNHVLRYVEAPPDATAADAEIGMNGSMTETSRDGNKLAKVESNGNSQDIHELEKDNSRGSAHGTSKRSKQPQMQHFFSVQDDAKPRNNIQLSSDSQKNKELLSPTEPKNETIHTETENSSSSSSSSNRSKKYMGPPSSSSLGFDKESRKAIDHLKASKELAENKIVRLEDELKKTFGKQKMLEENNLRIISCLGNVQREMAQQEARRKRDRLALDCVRLGKIATMRTSATAYAEVWEEGYSLKDLNIRGEKLKERREELSKRQNDLKNLKRRQGKKNRVEDMDVGQGDELDVVAESEAIQSHLKQLKEDEQALTEERRFLEGEKAAHQKELKRCQSEDRSRFQKDLPCLNSRYLLVSLLGRGGFSEVWKALDLLELKEVAIKIHQLNPAWSDDRKNSYIKHVTREYTIHKDMKHPRVVQLFDVFEIDNNSFATVLELCRGIDLDERLKRERMITEKDARFILLQIVSGLRYLNEPEVPSEERGDRGNNDGHARRKAIIHYDMKPANILFDEMGDTKITDFGLSKIIDDSNDDESLELTSQGAGTYWYLPPECFQKGATISSKVDVWSVGVIFYQMLFGKRPFGEGKSQENVLREGIMLNANQVDFPSDSNTPRVSDGARDFIRACLTHNKDLRPDVKSLCMHNYLSSKTKI